MKRDIWDALPDGEFGFEIIEPWTRREEMNILYLDIETIPTEEALASIPTEVTQDVNVVPLVYKPAAQSDPEEAKKQLCLSAITGRVLCLGFALNAEEPRIVAGSEIEILT